MARVLIVEDNDINMSLLQYLLGAFGHTVLSAKDGREGLRIVREQRPDVVICDIEMPRMNGVEFARAVRVDYTPAELPLLAVTSSAMVGDKDRFMAAGFDDYHAKPIDTEHFVAWMESHLYAAARAQAPPATHPTVPAPDSVAPRGPLILVVDDEGVNLTLKRSCLEPVGYRVMTASRTDEALALALETPPSLIISDVCMPVGDGFQFIIRVKQQPLLRDIPFIFITSTYSDDASRLKGLSLGASLYLHRPMLTEAFLHEVAKALGEPSSLDRKKQT